MASLDSRLVVATAGTQAVIAHVARASSTLAANKAAVARRLEFVLASSVDVFVLLLEVALKGVRGLTLALQIIRVIALGWSVNAWKSIIRSR